MMILSIFGWALRVAEVVFGAIVAGVLGSYLHDVDSHGSLHDQGRFIYTVVVAGLAILVALIRLLPFTHGFMHWPGDVFISILWWIAFGLLVDYVDDSNNCGHVFDWDNIKIRNGSNCQRWKASIAFGFLSALLWLVSAVVGYLLLRKSSRERTRHRAHDHAAATTHRRWYQRHGRV